MNWWARLLRRKHQDAHLEKELQFHIEQAVADLTRSGLTEAEARRRVRLEFGGMDQVKEACRDARGTRWIEDIGQDARYALRLLRAKSGLRRDCDRDAGVGNGHQHRSVHVLQRLRAASVACS